MADGDQIILPEDPANPYPLGRHVFHHPANRQFRALVGAPPAYTARTRPWATTWIGDQQATSSCTAYAAVGVCKTQPNTTGFNRLWGVDYDTHEERVGLYHQAQQVDPWPGSETTDPRYEGSSTDAPFRVLRDRGQITGWKWLFGEEELRLWLTHHGSASVGTVWKRNMFTPRPDGTLDCTGDVVGGHAYRIVYYDRAKNRYQKVGSWGHRWGNRGRAWINRDDMAALLADNGEAVTIDPA